LAADPKPRPHGLTRVDLKQPILWRSSCDVPPNTVFEFGGQSQVAPDGVGHTRIRRPDGPEITIETLRSQNAAQAVHDRLAPLAGVLKDAVARARTLYLDDLVPHGKAAANPIDAGLSAQLVTFQRNFKQPIKQLIEDTKYTRVVQVGSFEALETQADRAFDALIADVTPANIAALARVQIAVEQLAETTDAEPPPRALSPLAPDEKGGAVVLFCGVHLD
jgi:hypothetical protein